MNNNPFEYMQSFMNYDNFTKNMQSTDFSSFSNMIKNTTEAINSTNQMVSESLQSIFKRGSDSLQKNTTEMYNTMKDAISAGDVAQISACQKKYLQSTVDNNVNNTKEILDMSTKSMMEMGLSIQLCKFINKRLTIDLNSIVKFYQKMRQSFIPISNRHSPFCRDIVNCQV